MTTSIRAARSADWPGIAGLLTQHGLPTDGALDHLAHFLVAEQGGTIAGVAGLEVYGNAALLRSVAVGERRGGLGTSLVTAALDHARQVGVRDVVLLTTTAADFFPRFGFTPIARAEVPAALHASAEFRGACPASATAMVLRLVASS